MADPLPGLGDDVLVDEPADDEPEDLDRREGLGRGLAAIIPTLADLDAPTPRTRRSRRRGGVAALLGTAEPEAPEATGDEVPSATEPSHVPAPSAVRKLRDDLVGALLDGLANTMALDLCAYLHEGPGEEPHLFLQSPSLDAIGPERAYRLLDHLRQGLEQGRSDLALEAAGFQGSSVATHGDGSRGLWAVARVDDITIAEREVASRFCRSFGRAVHQLDGAAAPTTTLATPVRVQAHRGLDTVLAEVEVRIGDQIRPGHGRAGTRVEAITRAVLVAAGRHVTFRYASEVAHAGEHAAVVLLEGQDHAVALGSSLSAEPGGVATAQAAIRALDGLAA
ncbi:MAG TPA: hypothetical protein VD926_15245 [Acidimicrobiales bacterium]|nr:hypothetical protein [Acidimicrobiales bacterium]